MRSLLLLLSCCIWLALPVAISVAHDRLGAPYLIWSYKWFGDGRGYDPFARRYYTACVFIGFEGVRKFDPVNGECGWVRFAKIDAGAP